MVSADLFSKMSVRNRIVLLAVIPVIGLLAIGLAFKTGDMEVGRAFDSVHRDADVADASRDLKTGLLMMRTATTEFVSRPSDAEVKEFNDGQDLAVRSLARIADTLGTSEEDVITPLRITLRDLKASFESLVNELKLLGYTEHDGINADLNASSTAVEKIIHEDLSWVADVDASRLLMSLLKMRRDEIEYRLTRVRSAEKNFLDEEKNFNNLFDSVDGAPEMKKKLNDQVMAYSYTFAQWVASTDDIAPLLGLIEHDTASVLPEADKIIVTSRESADQAASALAASRARIRAFIAGVGISVVLIGLACSWRIGRSITQPL